MKKFISGFLIGAMLFGTIGAFAAQYIANPVSFKVMVNGEEFVSDPPALEVEGRTYLPLRAMGEALGVPVNWNQELNQAEVGNQAPVAEKNQYSRNNPAPINTVQTYTKSSDWYDDDNYSVNLRVMEIVRGEKVWEKIYAANKFNTKAPEGYEYVLVKIAFSVLNVKDDKAIEPNEYNFESFSSKNEENKSSYVICPEPELGGKLYAGGSTEGWIAVTVKKDDPKPKLVYNLDYDGSGGVWFALYE